MSTQFVSKNSNYMVVLKNGIEGNRILGTQPVAGIYIKFEGGIVTVKEESIAEMLRQHPSFGNDFIEVGENEKDPYADIREDSEPAHNIAEVKYGHLEKSSGTPPKVKVTPQMKQFIKGEAMKMLPDLLKENPEILRGIITDMAKEMKDKETTEKKEPIEKYANDQLVQEPKKTVAQAKKVAAK